MKRNLLTLFLLVAMLTGIVSSTRANPLSVPQKLQQPEQLISETVVARIYFSSQADLNSLAAKYDILEVKKDAGYALVILSPDDYASLQLAGYRIEVDEGKTALLNNPPQPLPGQGPDTIPGFPCYRTVEETYADLQSLAADNLDMTELIDIGDSWDKATAGGNLGYDILALRLSNENVGTLDDKPTFFLMAEIHAREYVTAEIATRLAEHLIASYGVDPDITWLLDYFRVYIVTMTNPDGRKLAEAGNWWRKNVDSDDGCFDSSSWGVDLNRNYDFFWGCCGGSDSNPCGETYRGPSAGSEPETIAIKEFVLSIFQDQRGPLITDPAPLNANGIMVTLHSAAGLVLWPWGWTGNDAPNGPQLQTMGRHMAYFNGYVPQQSNDLYTTDGTTDDWSYGELGVASFTYEMSGEFFEPCANFESYVYPDNRDALLYAFKSARLPYMNPAGPESIDLQATPAGVIPGDPVVLTATANDNRFGGSGEPFQNITAARYTIDDPSWITGTVTYPMTASDGNFNSYLEGIEATIDTTGLPTGKHTIFVESQDANNNWGVASAAFLYVMEPGVSPIIEGYVREATTNTPLEASISAGYFNSTSDPTTGYYSMTVISGTYDIVVEADNHAPAYANDITVQNYETREQDFSLYPVCNVFSDDVETGNVGWVPDNPWAITTEASHSPSHSWTDSPGGSYFNNRNISLTSPYFDFSNLTGVTLDFWHTYATESGYDYGYVEYDTGSGWNVVAAYNGNQGWVQEVLSIPGLDNQSSARLRFRFNSDGSLTYDGWHIDDINLSAGGPACMPAAAPIAEFTNNSPVVLGQPVNFINQSSGTEPITFAWDFGDGIGTSTEIDPSYLYIASGTYTVTLQADNEVGTDSISHLVTVEPLIFKLFLPISTK